jgi:hypothetical protein
MNAKGLPHGRETRLIKYSILSLHKAIARRRTKAPVLIIGSSQTVFSENHSFVEQNIESAKKPDTGLQASNRINFGC